MWPIYLVRSWTIYILTPSGCNPRVRRRRAPPPTPPPKVRHHLSFLHGIRALEERGSGAGKDEAGVTGSVAGCSGSGGCASGEHKGSVVSRLNHGGRHGTGAEQAGGADSCQNCR